MSLISNLDLHGLSKTEATKKPSRQDGLIFTTKKSHDTKVIPEFNHQFPCSSWRHNSLSPPGEHEIKARYYCVFYVFVLMTFGGGPEGISSDFSDQALWMLVILASEVLLLRC